MANEVELERMVVRLVGDSSQLTRTYQQTTTQTSATATKITAIVGRMAPEFNRIGMLMRAGLSLGVTGSAIAAPLAIAALEVKRYIDNLHKANAAANSAFQAVVTGARTAQQALSDVRVNTLTEGFKDLMEQMNPDTIMSRVGSWRNSLVGLFTGRDGLEVAMDSVIERSGAARRAVAAMANDPDLQRMRQGIAIERNVQGVRDSAQALREESERAGMSERASERYARVQQLVREGSVSLAEALRLTGRTYDGITESQRRVDIGNVRRQMIELRDESRRSGLSDVNQRLLQMAQAYRNLHPEVRTLADAFAAIGPEIAETRDLLNTISINNFTRDVRLQGATLGLSAERAQLFKMSMDGVADSTIQAALAEVKHLEALRALQAPLEKMEGARAGSTEALHRIAEYQRGLEVIAQTGSMRERILRDQQSGMASPTGASMLAGGAGAATVQAQALTTAQTQQAAGTVLQGAAAQAAGGAVSGDPALAVLRDIRTLLSNISQLTATGTQSLLPVGAN